MSIRPGAIVLTVMPSGPISRASVFSQPTTPGPHGVRERQVRDRLLHRRRLDRDDAAAAARPEVGEAERDEPDVRDEQELDRRDDGGSVDGSGGAGRRATAVEDEDVDAAERLDGGRHEALEIGGARSGRPGRRARRSAPLRARPRRRDGRTSPRSPLRRRAPRRSPGPCPARRRARWRCVPEVRGPWRAKRTRTGLFTSRKGQRQRQTRVGVSPLLVRETPTTPFVRARDLGATRPSAPTRRRAPPPRTPSASSSPPPSASA